jgi:hypothetical protein
MVDPHKIIPYNVKDSIKEVDESENQEIVSSKADQSKQSPTNIIMSP